MLTGARQRFKPVQYDLCLSQAIQAFPCRFQPWTKRDSSLGIEKKPETPFAKAKPTSTSFKRAKACSKDQDEQSVMLASVYRLSEKKAWKRKIEKKNS